MIKAVSSQKINKRDIFKVKFKRYFYHSLGFFIKPKLLFKFYLKYLLNRKDKKCFAVSSSIARAYFGARLNKTVNLDQLNLELPDWFYISTNKVHSLDYFVVNQDINHLLKQATWIKLSKNIDQLIAVDWKYHSTTYYKKLINSAHEGRATKKQHVALSSKKHIEKYFLRILALYNSIKRNTLLRHDNELVKKNNHYPVYVGINSDGSLFKLPSGKHRLAIAKSLGQVRVPVVINMMHADLIMEVMSTRQLDEVDAIEFVLSSFTS